ncbi:DUF2348 domain-containing protein/Hap2_elong domain-containing protein [Cephalotus follicularis]|uniref:DUF2348 domain-containing protein/Hap2_elong domain-containing protein n=1 Tax=Cephalotus follicularis TaxID=3775 RepID=A0A1Q3B7I7_CEPFO|nr:DUF2348 domain-containing protein/Hap2_elong domain-containing protein [Cephalotus follicularis]
MEQKGSSWDVVEQALGLGQMEEEGLPWALGVVLIEDRVETDASFLLHQLLKRSLSSNPSNTIIFLAFSHPFSHYDRILRKLGCNLVVHRENNRLVFLDMRLLQCPDGDEGKTRESGLVALYGKIRKTIHALPDDKKNFVIIMIDDVSLMEVAANGSLDHILDFLHYCHTLTAEFKCSLVMLNHEDIYSNMERPTFILDMEYLADVLIKAEPLVTGLATDVHGQLMVLTNKICHGQGSSRNKKHNFHFRVKENRVEYFYPGSRT